MPGGRRQAGALEREVMAVVAAAAGPLTPQQVLDGLDAPLAYTTVMTTLNRLHGKGALTRTASGRAYAYSLAGPSEEIPAVLTARQMVRLLDAGPDRVGALARFVAELGPEDEAHLTALLARNRDDEG